jgi:hypothetical protein
MPADAGSQVPALVRVFRTGYCYSRSPSDPELEFCKGINVSTVNRYEWVFEGEDYSGRPSTQAAHLARIEKRKACGRHAWDPVFLKYIS